MKIDPSSIVRDHLATLRDDRNGRISLFDLLVFYGIPLTGTILAATLKFSVMADAYNISITFFGIFIALLLNIQVAIFGILQRKRDEPRDVKLKSILEAELRSRRALLAELNANISYLVLFCCVALVAFLVFFVVQPGGHSAPAIAVGIYIHFLLTLIMVVKRSHALFQREYREDVV